MAHPASKLTLAEYLEWENQQPDKNEFYRGEVFAMEGARRVHGRVVSNLARLLADRLDGSGSQVFVSGMKLQIADDAIFYPDLLVTCDRVDLSTDMIFRSPKLVIEVLSPSTQAYDRGLKFAVYRRLTSLEETVLVDPDTRRVESFRRNSQGQWVLHDLSDGPLFEAASIGCSMPMDQVFDGVDPPAA